MRNGLSYLLQKALSAKPPPRCPIKQRAPRGEALHTLPPHLRGLLCLWVRLTKEINPRTNGIKSFWQTERANSLEFVLADSARAFGKHGLVNIEFYRNWQYGLTPLPVHKRRRAKVSDASLL